MRKRVLSILLTLCLVFVLLPSTALATPSFVLTVGNTDVSTLYEGHWDDTAVHYWKAAESGDDAYAETGSADDYLFSVSLDWDSESFTLTLNGVNITTANSSGRGVCSNILLNIVLVDGSSNSVNITGNDLQGIYTERALTISGEGSLNVTANGTGSITGICSNGLLTVSAGAMTTTATGSGYKIGLYAGTGVTVTGGTVTATASGTDSNGITVFGSDINISGGELSGAGENGVVTNGYAINISGGKLTACGGTEMGLDVYPAGSLNITGGCVTASSTSGSAMRKAPSDSSTDYNYRTSSTGDYTCGSYAYSESDKYIQIISRPEVYVSGDNTDSGTVKVSGITSGNTSYWLNDGSGSITSAGASAQSYNVKYNGVTQTLTLKDAIITRYHSDFMGEHQYGIYSQSDLNIVLGGNSVIGTTGTPAGTTGIQCRGNLSLSAVSGGSLSIVSHEYGIDADGDVAITGAQTTLNVTACTDTDDVGYGIFSFGNVLFADAAVSITKNGNNGDAVWAHDDIRISGGADISIVDWSISDGYDCGLHSNYGRVAIGGSAQVDICSQRIGIYARSSVYLGYVWNGIAYAVSGSPTVKINSPDSVAAITPDINNDFAIGVNGIKTRSGGINMAGGTLTAVGSEKALYFEAESLTLPSSYKYKSNTEASAPDGNHTFETYTTYGNDKYIEIITAQAPSGGYYIPSPTISVTETSSGLFNGAQGAIRAEANMTSAFSNSVEVKVTDTDERSSGFGLRIGNTVFPFDISLYIKGTNTKTEPNAGYAVTISLPIPDELLDLKEQISIAHKAGDGTVTTLASQIKQINGVWYLVFEATEFSPYALVVNSTGAYDETAGVPYYTQAKGNKVFIGLAANGKYVAPSGVTVLFRENAKMFTDIGSHWAEDYIGFVTEREIFLGTGSDTFAPDTGMTRAMFATVIGRLYERSYGEIEALSAHAFTDCDYYEYYGKYVDWAAEKKIIGGIGNGGFKPEDQISREQMAAILYRFADFFGVLPDDMDTTFTYPDADTISSWAKNAALYCQSSGIITGRNGGSFAPTETATRAEVAAIIQRFVELALN